MRQLDPSRDRKAFGRRAESAPEPSEERDQPLALAAELELAEERERKRIASGLHDQVGQLLGVAKIKLGEALAAKPAPEVAGPVSESRRLLDQAIREIRALTFEMSSPALLELGLEAALADLAERLEERHHIPCRFKRSLRPVTLPEELAALLHSIVRELLWNVVKHASARRAAVAIGRHRDGVRIEVRDDGVGFDPARVFDRPDPTGGLGLLGARTRLEVLGGAIDIDSATGRGTKIVLTVPCSR